MPPKRFIHATVRFFAVLLVLIPFQQTLASPQENSPERLRYDVDATRASGHTIHVTIHVPAEPTPATDLAIPAWSPGYYQILDFRRDIHDLHATDMDGHTLPMKQLDSLTWRVAASGPFLVDYDVQATEAGFGFFRCHADAHTAYINGAAAFLYLPKAKDRPCSLRIRAPSGWRIAVPLEPLNTPQSTTTGVEQDFRAHDYEDLIDAPIQMGELEQLDFRVHTVPFSIVLVGQSSVSRDALKDTVARIASAGMQLFGSVPFPRYMFLIHFAVGSFSGGLEHRASAVLNVPASPSDSAYPWASLIAHEYFHAWNVKRIRPAGLGPFDLTTKVPTASLWFVEGVTDYYSQVLLRMAGITGAEEFLAEMARRIAAFENNPAHLRISAEEASRRAWEGGSMGYAGLDYYIAGSVLGFMLDIEIRSATGGSHSLDDVLRLLDRKYGAANRAYPESAILEAINQVAGRDLSDLYQRTIRAPARIPWNEILGHAGLALGEPNRTEPYLGVICPLDAASPAVVEAVDPGSAAANAGLMPGDVVTAVDGVPVTAGNIRNIVAHLQPGESVVISITRAGTPAHITLPVGSKRTSGGIVLVPDADPLAMRIRAGLLREGPVGSSMSPAPEVTTKSPAG